MSHSNEVYEMQAPTSPPDITNVKNHDDQVWRDVKAETGFSSYNEYVKSLVNSEQHFGVLIDHLNYTFTYAYNWGEVLVLDVQKDGSMVTSFDDADERSKHKHLGSFPDLQASKVGIARKISTRLLKNLRSPQEDIPARIVLWSIPRGKKPHPSIINALGLGLDVDPSFFEHLNQLLVNSDTLALTRSHEMMIGDSIVTVARDYRCERHAPPVLVIAGCIDLHSSFSSKDRELDEQYHWIFDKIVNEEISGGTSVFRSTINKRSPNSLESMSSNYYLKLLGKYFHKKSYVGLEDDTSLLIAVLPLLRLEILRLRCQCSFIATALRDLQHDIENPGLLTVVKKETRYTILDKYRFWLRWRLENLQQSIDHFLCFARSQNAENLFETKIWLREDTEIRKGLAMARNIELEVRDYMQLQIGNLSIAESRKSIQLSNQQMNEARRAKILTILAFVYVPINLATSIFGMNLQQLNQSGQNVWSFVITASVSLLVTAFFWLAIELYNSVEDYERKRIKELLQSDYSTPKRSIAVRVGICLGLINRELWERYQ